MKSIIISILIVGNLMALENNILWEKGDLLGFDAAGDSPALDITTVFNQGDYFRLQFMDLNAMAENTEIWLLLDENPIESDFHLNLPFVNPYPNMDRAVKLSENFPDLIVTPEKNRLEIHISQGGEFNAAAVVIIEIGSIIDSGYWFSGSRGDVGNAAFVHHGNQGLTYSAVFYGEEPMEDTGFDEVLELHQSTGVPGNFHLSGTLMSAAEWHNPEFNDWMSAGVSEGWAAMLTSAFGQQIMPFVTDEMNNWSVAIETDMVEFLYNYSPKVAWIPERVWLSPGEYPEAGVADWLGDNFEQHGVDAVLLDDWPHLNGYSSTKIHYMNNGSGINLRVIPINGSFTGNVHYNPGEAINQIQSGQYEILVYGTDWEVVAEMNENNGTDRLENYSMVINWCAENYPGVDVWKLDNALNNTDFNGSGVDITNGNYELIGGADGYGGGNNGWYTDWAATGSLSDFHDPQWTYGYIWDNAKNNLMTAPNNGLAQLGWYTLMTNLHETAWHDYVGGPISGWEHHYSAHIKNANVYAEASRWANGDYSDHTAAYFQDIDQDGSDELIMYNERIFAVIEGAGGRVQWLFYNDGSGSAYSVVGSDVAYYSETDGDFNEDSNNHVAALSDVYPNQQHELYEIQINSSSGNEVEATLSLGSVSKNIILSEEDNYLDVQYQFSAGTGYIKSGWSPDLLDLIWAGKSHLQRIFGDYASYVGYRNSTSGATAAMVLGSGGAAHNYEFEGTLVRGDEIYGEGIFNVLLYAGYTSEPYDEYYNKVTELDVLADGLIDESGPLLLSAIQPAEHILQLTFSNQLDSQSVEDNLSFTLAGSSGSQSFISAFLTYGRKLSLVFEGNVMAESISVLGVTDLNGNEVDPDNNTVAIDQLAVIPHLVGTFNDWDPENHDFDLALSDVGLWEADLSLVAGSYEYKVIETNAWDDNDWPGTNQIINLTSTGTVNIVANCGFITGSRSWDEYVSHTNPIITGDFISEVGGENWNPADLTGEMLDENGDGIYSCEVEIPTGDWEYKVVLNQNWDQDTYGAGANFTITLDGENLSTFYYDFRQNGTYTNISEEEGCENAPGDANEDGAINVLDVVNVVNHILGNSLLEGCGLEAADYNTDGAINVLDIVGIVNVILLP